MPPTFTPRVVEAETTPLPFVVSMPEGEPETVRFVVLAVPKYPVPEIVRAFEVEAYVKVSLPAESKVEVAVAPKYAGPYEEKSVVDAPPLKIMSEVVADEVRVGWVKGSEPPPLPVASVPQMIPPFASVSRAWEQPRMFPSWRPFAKVEVAEVPVTLRYVLCTPPVNVLVDGEPNVAAPEEALKERAAVVEVAETEEVAR